MVDNIAGPFGILSSGSDLVPITPDDNTDLAKPARALRCRGNATGGTLRVTTYAGEVRNTYIDAGELLTLVIKRVHDTGTTATGLEAFI